ncbi:MAG: lipocalin family protein [Bacteroidales bacterium]|nr:lipocalin family protein [Bacteroidales bacterium]
MKKIFLLGAAIIAALTMFTACGDDEEVENALVGTWFYKSEPAEDSGWMSETTVIFKKDGSFEYQDAAYSSEDADKAHDTMFFTGTYSIKDDVVTISYKSHGWIYDGKRETVPEFETYDEKIKFSVQGKTLTLVREYGTEYEYTTEYTKQ